MCEAKFHKKNARRERRGKLLPRIEDTGIKVDCFYIGFKSGMALTCNKYRNYEYLVILSRGVKQRPWKNTLSCIVQAHQAVAAG